MCTYKLTCGMCRATPSVDLVFIILVSSSSNLLYFCSITFSDCHLFVTVIVTMQYLLDLIVYLNSY